MNVIKDFKGWIALGILVLGTVCTTLALWTDHWYDIKMATDRYGEENIPGINLFCFWDSYKTVEREMLQKIIEKFITAFQLAS